MPKILTEIFQFTECPKQAPHKRRRGDGRGGGFQIISNRRLRNVKQNPCLLAATTTCSDVKLFERGLAAPFDFYLGLFLGHDLGTKA